MKCGKQSDIVKEFGVSRNAISLLVKAKDYRIRYTPGGKIDVDATVEALRKSGFGKRSDLMKRKKKALKNTTAQAIAPTPEEYQEDVEKGGPLTLDDSRERIDKHKAFHQSEKFRIDNEEKTNKLIPINEVSESSFNLWRPFRDELQTLSDRASMKVRSAESDHEAEQILKAEAHRILSSVIAGYKETEDDGLKKKLLQRLISRIVGH